MQTTKVIIIDYTCHSLNHTNLVKFLLFLFSIRFSFYNHQYLMGFVLVCCFWFCLFLH